MIRVKNSSEATIRVAINRWGTGGDTTFFSIAPGEQRPPWGRRDRKGFVMALDREGSVRPYYVVVGSVVEVTEDTVTDRGVTMEPIDRSNASVLESE